MQKISTWSELSAIVGMAVILLAFVTAFIHTLDSVEELSRENAILKAQIAKGVLPITEERLNQMKTQLETLDRKLQAHIDATNHRFGTP
ncbi:MAG: hypothetical protein PHQ40_21605 [Anaerolineaceae bacterium]|nr:hypothetical protein [Anaerolineaceae bacterium]